ncbi:glycoside hydrolase family 104 protein [uncultured Sphingomonas sp.]|uniref:glycoside hydrolase family 24 protein n=1 Tax=uncultured Sphingomonas sp. TaxID=158754 RepID=UPI00259638E6|nr:glycoside hydrolase family 104 protein [uncultured Sphingomonas sp.]
MERKPAFLTALAFSEGTDKPGQPTRNKGYDVIVGGALFTDYSDHPRVLVPLPKLGIKSTGAGRYQILARFYDHYKAQLGLKDFSPASQDAIAWQLIGECGARGDVLAGNFEVAIHKCRSRWASLPGAGYGQHEHKMETLRKVYDDAIRS